ncbi:hypothetical protein HHK36_001850 [Tetracentron sinense]|uniref:S5 DRBM domain-containing protein n=1 Tax=Tetracentron sinense TaxID=13715 RepID=A0A835A3F0_TETSI|nr:hypothetical protein HHK36_001850 [Tetracentron sinense]
MRRVTKVVKGGKQVHFRAIVVMGDKQGQVGVGVEKAEEVIVAVQKCDGDYRAAKVMLRPASPGTGVIAGGTVRIALEMAGLENALGKQLGSHNAFNNASTTVVAVQKKEFSDVVNV